MTNSNNDNKDMNQTSDSWVCLFSNQRDRVWTIDIVCVCVCVCVLYKPCKNYIMLQKFSIFGKTPLLELDSIFPNIFGYAQ
jgi:hypothetical protein